MKQFKNKNSTNNLPSLMECPNTEVDNENDIANLFKTYFSRVYSNTSNNINSANNF